MYIVVLHLFLPRHVRKEGRKPALFAAICASSSLAAVLCTLEMNGDVFVIRKLSKSIILSWTWVVCIPGKLLIINCTRRRYTGASRIVCVGGCVFGGEEQGRETRNAINLAVKPRRRNNTLWEIHYYYSWKVDGAGLAWVPCCCCVVVRQENASQWPSRTGI